MMKRIQAIAAACLLLATPAAAVTVTEPASVVVLGYCQLSVTTAVLVSTCSGGIPVGATRLWLTPETAAIRWRDDGTAPTASIGYPVSTGQQLVYYGNLPTLQVIAQTGTSTVNIAFYRY